MHRNIERMLDMAGELTPEDTARVAGELFALAGVNRDTFAAFWAALGETDRGELAAWVEDAERE